MAEPRPPTDGQFSSTHPSIPPSVVGAITSCQLTPPARHKSNQQLPASLGLPRPQAAEPSQLQASSRPTAARSGTPGLPARPPARPSETTDSTGACTRPASRPWTAARLQVLEGSGQPGLAPLRALPATLLGPDLAHGSHSQRPGASHQACLPEAFLSRGRLWIRSVCHSLGR